MLVTSLCWWLYDSDWFERLVAKSLCWRLFPLCWWFFQCMKSVTNILNPSLASQTYHQHIWVPTSVTNIDVTSKTIVFNRIFRKSEKLEEFKVTVPKSLVLFTMKRLMATSSMSRLNQKIIKIVSFLTEYEPIVFSDDRWNRLDHRQAVDLAEIGIKLKKIQTIKKRAGNGHFRYWTNILTEISCSFIVTVLPHLTLKDI